MQQPSHPTHHNKAKRASAANPTTDNPTSPLNPEKCKPLSIQKRMPNQNGSDKSRQPEALIKPRTPNDKNAFQHPQKDKTKAQYPFSSPCTHPADPNHPHKASPANWANPLSPNAMQPLTTMQLHSDEQPSSNHTHATQSKRNNAKQPIR